MIGFVYVLVNVEVKLMMVFCYKFYISINGRDWKEVLIIGEFSNIMYNFVLQIVLFGNKVSVCYIKFDVIILDVMLVWVDLKEIGICLQK